MCYWGIAVVLGPNINAPMEADALPEAWQALQKAIALSNNATEQEKAYIQALAKRYPPQWVEDRKSHDLEYANAMSRPLILATWNPFSQMKYTKPPIPVASTIS